MGGACSRAKKVDKGDDEEAKGGIDQRIAQEKKADKRVRKLLLLGAGESGKSTIFKQIKVLFQTGFDDVELKNYTPVVHANVYQAIKILLDGCQEFAAEEGAGDQFVLQPDMRAVGDAISELVTNLACPELTPEVAVQIESLWKDTALQAAYARSSELQLPDCTRYFLDDVQRLAAKDYVPTPEDVLHARVRTTGIVETEFCPADGAKRNANSDEIYKMFDVGGQRNERRKWMHLFDGVTAVIFCAALSEYDQTLFEDEAVNRMMEAKELFEWVLKQPWFEKTSFLVFLNKFDIFEKKVLRVPLSVCEWFKDYKPLATGRTEVEEKAEVEHAFQYIHQKFIDLYRQNTDQEKNIHREFRVYRTTALDRLLVKQTFTLIDKALTKKTLIESGLL